MKKKIAVFLVFIILFSYPLHPYATSNTTISSEQPDESTTSATISLKTPSAILMEAETGTVLFEKSSHDKMRPASITKVMTLILIFEALESGLIHKDDIVTISEHAASMGGSQVFLEVGEEQTVEDLIKCISIASANDACVAMAEFISGSEDAFVNKMNEKAMQLNMTDTCFENCCGLEAEGHLTSAYDIALMSQELINNHPDIFNYCSIWMDKIYHSTKKGTFEFGLTNTNKLLRYYSYTTGLKTGYTSKSKYCISATAKKDDIHLIAVVMAEESSTIRNKEAVALLNYGFANCHKYIDENTEAFEPLPIKHGTKKIVSVEAKSSFITILTNPIEKDEIQKNIIYDNSLSAPLAKGDSVGKIVYTISNKEIGSIDLIACEDINQITLLLQLKEMIFLYLNKTVIN